MDLKEKRVPLPRRTITDEEFEAQLANRNNASIIESVVKLYTDSFSREELYCIGLRGLWRALQYYNPMYKQKFTTSLYTVVKWECKRELTRRLRQLRPTGRRIVSLSVVSPSNVRMYHRHLPEEEAERNENIDHLRVRMSRLSEEDRQLIESYYFEHKPIRLIARELGCCRETIRQRMARARDHLRELCQMGLQ